MSFSWVVYHDDMGYASKSTEDISPDLGLLKWFDPARDNSVIDSAMPEVIVRYNIDA